MRKFNTVKIMALGLAACALAAGAFAAEAAEPIFDYNLTGKYWDAEKQKVSNYKLQGYLVWDDGGFYKVRYWRNSSKIKYYHISEGHTDSNFSPLDDVDKNFRFMEDGEEHAANGFGTARWTRDGLLNSLNITGAFCKPTERNGTLKVRFNKSLTNKAVKNGKSAYGQIVEELERKGYMRIH